MSERVDEAEATAFERVFKSCMRPSAAAGQILRRVVNP